MNWFIVDFLLDGQYHINYHSGYRHYLAPHSIHKLHNPAINKREYLIKLVAADCKFYTGFMKNGFQAA